MKGVYGKYSENSGLLGLNREKNKGKVAAGMVAVRKFTAVFLAVALVLSFTVNNGRIAFTNWGEAIYAATSVKIDQGNNSARKGEQNVTITVTVVNSGDTAVKTYGIIKSNSDISVVNERSSTVDLAKNESKDISFLVDVKNSARTGASEISLSMYTDSGSIIMTQNIELEIYEKTSAPATGTNPLVAMDMDYSFSTPDGIVAGEETILTLTLYNRSNSMMKNAYVNLDLPDGLYLHNTTSSQNIGYLMVGDQGTVRFTLKADEDMDSKSYPIDITLSFQDQSNNDKSLSDTLYVPVKSSKTKFTVDNLEIKNISIPAEITAGEDFTLSFTLANNGPDTVSDLQVEASMPEGVVNKTKNIFVVPSIAAGKTETFTLTATTTDKSKEESYPVKITVSSTKEENKGTISQYAGTYSKVEDEDSDTKTPQLMVSSYSYGGSHVQAGDNFSLNLGLYNTSKLDIKNIKVTVTSDDGVFIPVNSSNAFYLDSIAAKGRDTHSIPMTSKRDAEQKTSSLTVEMSYEDKDGNDFTSKDVISIPVMQETRLVIDDLISPPDIYVGNQSYTSLEFYNMGKTTLNNLRINATGNFSANQSNSYYVGNMEPGSQDSYDFSYIPMEAGVMTGTVTFNYETATGELITVEKDFEFDVMEMAPWDDWGDEYLEEVEKPMPWATIIAGVVIVLLIIVVVVVLRIRKKKKLELEMEIDE